MNKSQLDGTEIQHFQAHSDRIHPDYNKFYSELIP